VPITEVENEKKTRLLSHNVNDNHSFFNHIGLDYNLPNFKTFLGDKKGGLNE